MQVADAVDTPLSADKVLARLYRLVNTPLTLGMGYAELLVEDYKIRQYVDKRLNRTPPFAAVLSCT